MHPIGRRPRWSWLFPERGKMAYKQSDHWLGQAPRWRCRYGGHDATEAL